MLAINARRGFVTEPDSPAQRPSLIRQFGLFIGWLSGATVGLAALLSGFGYVAVGANARFLGLDPVLVSYSSVDYLQRGAEAWIYIALSAAATFITLSLILIVPPVLSWIARWAGRVLPRRESGAASFVRRHADLWRLALYCVLLAYIYFVFYDRNVEQFQTVLRVSDVLYKVNPTEEDGAQEKDGAQKDGAQKRIVCGQNDDNVVAFNKAVIVGGIAIALLLLATRATARMTSFRWLLAPFAVVVVLFLYMLGSLYGALLMERRFSPVELDTGTGPEDGLYLIDETSDRFVLWRPADLTIIAVAEGDVKRLALHRRLDLRKIHPGLVSACQ
jgi:hypothetical protein